MPGELLVLVLLAYALATFIRGPEEVGMPRAVIEGKYYDTDISTVVHANDMGGGYAQTLYETPNGRFFYVNEFPHSAPAVYSFEGLTCVYRSWAQDRGMDHQDGYAVIWLERHNGADVILDRWPHMVEAG